jgi:hypothetical protein
MSQYRNTDNTEQKAIAMPTSVGVVMSVFPQV